MADFFPKAELTGAGRPIFLPGEFECSLVSAVDLESQDEPRSFSPLKTGILTLTTHRLLWLPSGAAANSAVFIPLASISHIFAPKKSIKSMFASPRIRFQVSTLVLNPGSNPKTVVVTAVVRGKGDWEGFYGKLWENWRGRAWENEAGSSASESGYDRVNSEGGLYGSDGSVRMVGVAGILRKEQQMWESTDKSLQEAFQDLHALMVILLVVL